MDQLSILFVNDSLDDKPGISKPVRITASDHQDYVLKANIVEQDKKKYQFDASFLQEMLVSRLAEQLDVPTPTPAIISISSQDFDVFPKLRFSGGFTKPGLYFATKYIDDCTNDIVSLYKKGIHDGQKFVVKQWHSLFKNILNKDAIPRIFALDFLTMNADRFTNSGNVLLTEQGEGQYVMSIDYGFCFYSPFWRDPMNNLPQEKIQQLSENNIDLASNEAVIKQLNRIHSHFLTWSYEHSQGSFGYGMMFSALDKVMECKSGNPFLQIVSDIERISVDNIREYLNEIPKTWFVDGDAEKQAYLGFLIRQAPLIKPLLNFQNGMGIFSNLKGGVLQWQNEDASSIG